jgi:NAD(P)-dependent dehydrogenase (short-subunit alcohol dehydrogenase family)
MTATPPRHFEEQQMPPIINYQNKTVVVTGAATGVGAALVDRLRAAQVERIIALDIKPCKGAVDQFIPTDLSDPVAIDDAIHRLPESIDVLFNNAGVAATLPLRAVMGVNVLAPRRLIASLHQRMPPGSAIVNTASTAGGGFMERMTQILELLAIDDWRQSLDWVEAHPGLTQNPYGFSKECAQVLTLQQAAPLAKYGIRINSVCPGLIDTPLIADFQTSMGKPILDWMISQSGGRKATPGEVADALAFLGSDAASYINGTNLLIDNGFSAAITTNQIDYSTMPAVDALTNSSV